MSKSELNNASFMHTVLTPTRRVMHNTLYNAHITTHQRPLITDIKYT